MKAWGLYTSLHVDPYHRHELVEVFADEATADQAREGLIGKPVDRTWAAHEWCLRWKDDEDFPDLYVRPIELR